MCMHTHEHMNIYIYIPVHMHASSEIPHPSLRLRSEPWSCCDIIEFYNRFDKYNTCSITTFPSTVFHGRSAASRQGACAKRPIIQKRICIYIPMPMV